MNTLKPTAKIKGDILNKKKTEQKSRHTLYCMYESARVAIAYHQKEQLFHILFCV